MWWMDIFSQRSKGEKKQEQNTVVAVCKTPKMFRFFFFFHLNLNRVSGSIGINLLPMCNHESEIKVRLMDGVCVCVLFCVRHWGPHDWRILCIKCHLVASSDTSYRLLLLRRHRPVSFDSTTYNFSRTTQQHLRSRQYPRSDADPPFRWCWFCPTTCCLFCRCLHFILLLSLLFLRVTSVSCNDVMTIFCLSFDVVFLKSSFGQTQDALNFEGPGLYSRTSLHWGRIEQWEICQQWSPIS